MAEINSDLYSKEGDTRYKLNPSSTAEQIAIADKDGNASNVSAEIISLRTRLSAIENGGLMYKGTVSSTVGLPTVGYKAGWQYSVAEAGTYAGQTCEVGDMIVCVKDYASGSAKSTDWNVLQVNIVGAVSGPSKSVANHVATFSGTSGTIIQDSGFTIRKSVPADAEFTDTTYSAATADSDGLLSASLYGKLVGIEAKADVTDTANVTASGAFMKATDTADSIRDGSSKVVMTPTERAKLSGIEGGAQVNQKAFSAVTVNGTAVSAAKTQDTLDITSGSGITMTSDSSARKLTVSETYIDSCIVSSLDDVPSNLRNGGLIVLKETS